MDGSLLKKATSDDESPIQGFMLTDIARRTYRSSEAIRKLVMFLQKRLTKIDSPFVLLKSLRIIKTCSEDGHMEFKQQMREHAELIRSLCSYHGEVHPLYGHRLIEDVRNSAGEAISSLYTATEERHTAKPMTGFGSEEVQSSTSISSESGQSSSFQAFSSGSHGSGSHVGGSGSKVYSGIASPYFEHEPPTQSLTERMVAAYERGKANAKNKWNKLRGNESSSGMSAPSGVSTFQEYQTTGTFQPPISSDSGGTSSYKPTLITSPEASVKLESSSGVVEGKIVEDITNKRGVRPNPSPKELREFVNRAKKLNLKQILVTLNDKLEEGESYVQIRALWVIEALFNQLRSNEDILEFLLEHHEQIAYLAESPKLSLSGKAKSILRKLRRAVGEEDDEEEEKESAKKQGDLVDLKDESVESPGGTADLFAGLNVSSSNEPSGPVQTEDDLFEGLEPKSAPVSGDHPSNVFDVLEGMNQEEAPEKAKPPMVRSMTEPVDVDSFFGGEVHQEKGGKDELLVADDLFQGAPQTGPAITGSSGTPTYYVAQTQQYVSPQVSPPSLPRVRPRAGSVSRLARKVPNSMAAPTKDKVTAGEEGEKGNSDVFSFVQDEFRDV